VEGQAEWAGLLARSKDYRMTSAGNLSKRAAGFC
jgi:hypothetical protein